MKTQSKIPKSSLLLVSFSIFFLLFTHSSNGQANIGKTFDELRKEFIAPEYNFEIEMQENNLTVRYETQDFYILHFLNDEKIVIMTVMYPVDDGRLHAMVEFLNKNVVILSDTKWRQYTTKQYVDINLIINDQTTNTGPMFIWESPDQ